MFKIGLHTFLGVILHLFCEENAVITGNVVVAVDDVEVVVAVVKGAAASLHSCCTSSDTSKRLFDIVIFSISLAIFNFKIFKFLCLLFMYLSESPG